MRSASGSPPLRLRRSPPGGQRQRTGAAGSAAFAGHMRLAAAAFVALLAAGCASVPEAVKKPVEAVQQAVSSVVAAAPAPAAASPVNADAQRAFDAARAALRAGRTAEAERGFRELAAKHPELGGAHANLGLILRNAGKHEESVAALERAVKASPNQPLFFNQLGVSLRHKGQFAKAREAYGSALALDPAYADAHLNLGVLLDLYLGDTTLALVHYERYLALGGDAAVGKWIADLKARKPASVAQANVKGTKKE
jgi:tetratricopeptide (TPR) repeat protein